MTAHSQGNRLGGSSGFLRPGVCIICCFLVWTHGVSQDFKRQFKDAREFFNKQDYTRAMDAFKPLIVYDENNPYPEYASYYYGLSAYKLGFATVAKDIFLQTRKLYPQWDQLDEVNYLLAKIYFDQHEYFQALLILKSIRNLGVSKDVAALKRTYLSQITDVETLHMVVEDNPEDPECVRAFLKALAQEPLPVRDGTLLDSLIHKFQFTRTDFITDIAPLVSTLKDRYSVSLLFPFLASTLDADPGIKRNQFALDLYEGMKQASDTLHHEGIYLDLLAYDTERDAETIKKLLETPELKSTDLIVGPLFLEECRLLLPFSEQNKINIINPVSSNSDFLGQNPFALLAQPSVETLGSKSAELVASHAKNKNCLVYYSDSPKDSVEAFNFIRKAMELGLHIVLSEEIHKETSGKILTTLASATKFDEWKNPTQFTLKLDSIGSIFVASDDPVIYSKVISATETRGDSVLVVGHENWIVAENTSVDFSIYERLGVMFASPNFTSLTNPEYITFRREYIHRHGILPSAYAAIGYEFILFVGRLLHRYGVYFQSGLDQAGVLHGTITEGHYYPGTRDNQVVPFVQFHGGTLVVVDKK